MLHNLWIPFFNLGKAVYMHSVSVESMEYNLFNMNHIAITGHLYHFHLYRDRPYPPLCGTPSPQEKALHFS